jgi:hypothetical protein
MTDVFADPEEIGRITCPGCENHLSSILRAFRDGEACPSCGLPADVARQVLEARRKGAEEGLQRKYLEAMKRALDAERERDDLRERLLEMRKVANRPWKPL